MAELGPDHCPKCGGSLVDHIAIGNGDWLQAHELPWRYECNNCSAKFGTFNGNFVEYEDY